MRFRVRYGDPTELLTDHEQQFTKGGFLVRVEPSAEIELYAAAELELVANFGRVVLRGQVVQTIDGVGVAVAFDPGDAGLLELVDDARAASPGGAAAVHSRVDESRDDRPSESYARVQAAGKADKIHLARYGKRDERMQIMRGGDRSLHRHVLNNPGLGLDEVVFIAKMTTLSGDILKAIADRREWAQRPEVALALVRNPKTPVPLAIKMLNYVSASDLRQLAKSTAVRMPILQAARKKVLR